MCEVHGIRLMSVCRIYVKPVSQSDQWYMFVDYL